MLEGVSPRTIGSSLESTKRKSCISKQIARESAGALMEVEIYCCNAIDILKTVANNPAKTPPPLEYCCKISGGSSGRHGAGDSCLAMR